MMNLSPRVPPLRRAAQRGLTLLELMIALTISLIVVLAALAALLFARDGFSTVDTASQLRENARFATTLITRVVLQAGYQEWSEASGSVQRLDASQTGVTVEPDIQGFNNAVFNPASPGTTGNGTRPASCGASTDTKCLNGSDVLMIRYQGHNDSTGAPDGSMIDCSGAAQGAITAVGNINQRATSYFYVDLVAGEPTLMCASLNAAGTLTASPLIEGIESFQVLYGAYQVTANTAPTALPIPPAPVINQWLRADQFVVTGNVNATNQNWQRVLAVRVGIVMRSPTSQSGTATSGTTVVYPFVDQSVPSANDTGVALTVAADRRVRQAFTFTINLRNSLL